MNRSPLAYPLTRGADMDVGGAADLQTDVMRFMAILSLCLVAIFALVQSMPISPPASTTEPVSQSVPEPLPETLPERVPDSLLQQIVEPHRPKWKPDVPKAVPAAITTDELPAPPTEESEGFSLRFESDLALSRLVAASQIGVYAIEGDRARRMAINNSSINFWDASVPNSFHEMEVSTVPLPVVNALVRTGADTAEISWGVTLPGKLKSQLDRLMQEHRGGALVIGTDGNIRLEAL